MSLALIAGLAAITSPVRAGDRLFTPLDVARLQSVSAAQIAPNGRHIAYVLTVPRRPWVDDDGPPWAELHVVDASGASRPFVAGKVNVSDIHWMPDGNSIAFRAKRGDDKETALYVIALDGGEARKVLDFETGIGAYALCPTGDRAAFIAREKEAKSIKDRKDKGFKAEVFEEDAPFAKLWIKPLRNDRSSWREDSDDDAGKSKPLAVPGSVLDVEWSPMGDRLAVATAPTPSIDDDYMRRTIHVVDTATGEVTGKFDTVGKVGAFRWSRDGKKLAALCAADLHDPSPGRLMVGDAGGGKLKDVLPDLQGHVIDFAWQDGDTVMYLADEGLFTSFGKVDADGSNQKAILPAGKFVLSGLSLAGDGMSGALLIDSPEHPAEVAIMRHGDVAPTQLTQSNSWLPQMRMARQEAVSFKARDGLEIQGVLVRPLDEQPGQRYPLILCVHGGPESHDRMGWSTQYARPGQVAAARGFAVFYPNYRGSTGRGVAFSKLDQADYAGKEFDDLVDAAEYLSSTGLVDKAKVGVTGGSYGGFATAWCSTALSEHFAAGVMFVGLSDLVSKFGTTDIPQEMSLVHATKYPWEDWEFFRQRSPITHFQDCRTPLLIMGGKDDTRVDPSQSMELYRYIKTWGKTPVRLVMFPGEGHGNRKSASRLEYNLRMMQWFEHYLKGPGGDPPAYELDFSGIKPKEKKTSDAEKHDDAKDDKGG